jgi:hypothetical protein
MVANLTIGTIPEGKLNNPQSRKKRRQVGRKMISHSLARRIARTPDVFFPADRTDDD